MTDPTSVATTLSPRHVPAIDIHALIDPRAGRRGSRREPAFRRDRPGARVRGLLARSLQLECVLVPISHRIRNWRYKEVNPAVVFCLDVPRNTPDARQGYRDAGSTFGVGLKRIVVEGDRSPLIMVQPGFRDEFKAASGTGERHVQRIVEGSRHGCPPPARRYPDEGVACSRWDPRLDATIAILAIRFA